ncbi:hypothetical protein D3C86_1393930 [compost metagenome]
MARSGVEQGRITAHVRVVTQARTSALGFGDPGLALALDHPETHQLSGFLSQPVEHRLHDIRTTARQITEPHCHQFGRQVVTQIFRILPHIAQPNQLGQQAVGRAFWNVQLLRQRLHRQAAGVAGKVFEHTENTFDLTAGHGNFHAKFARV